MRTCCNSTSIMIRTCRRPELVVSQSSTVRRRLGTLLCFATTLRRFHAIPEVPACEAVIGLESLLYLPITSFPSSSTSTTSRFSKTVTTSWLPAPSTPFSDVRSSVAVFPSASALLLCPFWEFCSVGYYPSSVGSKFLVRILKSPPLNGAVLINPRGERAYKQAARGLYWGCIR